MRSKLLKNFAIPVVSVLVGLIFGVPAPLLAQVEYAVVVREAGTRKTTVGGGATIRDSHTNRLFGVARVDFGHDPTGFERPISWRGVPHARRVRNINQFSPRPLAEEAEFKGASYLVNGRSGLQDFQALESQDSNEPTWIFPQGPARLLRLVPDGAYRQLATRYTSPFSLGLNYADRIAATATGATFTLDEGLSHELNAHPSPGSLLDARTKLINLLTSRGWVNFGEDAF